MNTQEFECPCIDCITLPICKSKLDDVQFTTVKIYILKDRCELLNEYLFLCHIELLNLEYRYKQIEEVFKMEDPTKQGANIK